MQAKQIWQTALSDLEQTVSRANFETWLRNTEIIAFEDDCATIGAPNSFAVEQLRNKFAVQIQNTLSVILGRKIAVQFTVLNRGRKRPPRPASAARRGAPASEPPPLDLGSLAPSVPP